MLITTGTGKDLPRGQDAPTAIDSLGNKVELEGRHAYTVMNYNPVNRIVTVRNPWGENFRSEDNKRVGDGYINMPLDEFQKVFEYLTIEGTARSR